MKPVAIDLFCGLGGWADGLLAEGWDVIGYDIEAHDYGTGGYPGTLIMQDVTTLHGSRFAHVDLIVASPPCQAYSYRAMPWSRAKALPPPDNTLFETCFRIQREASEAAGRHIPMVVENVRGAQKWVGPAAWKYGSFYLWGDVPALMPTSKPSAKVPGLNWKLGSATYSGKAFNDTAIAQLEEGIKQGGDWFGKNCETSMSRLYGSKSPKRKMASAMIAKIPFPLSQHIARAYYPSARTVAETAKHYAFQAA